MALKSTAPGKSLGVYRQPESVKVTRKRTISVCAELQSPQGILYPLSRAAKMSEETRSH